MNTIMSGPNRFAFAMNDGKNGNLTIINAMRDEVKKAENSKDSRKLQKVAEQHIQAIMEMLETQQEKIDNAKRLASRAKDIAKNDGFFSRAANRLMKQYTFGILGTDTSKEMAKANTDGLIAINEAVAEMNKVMQNLVALTCCSATYSKIMIEEMNEILTEGIINVEGEIQQLTKSQIELVEQLLSTTKQHAAKAIKDEGQDKQIRQNAESISKNKGLISQNAEFITQNKQAIKNIKILAWIATMLSMASLSVSIFCFLK